MRKIVSMLLIALMWCGLLTGCGEKEDFSLKKPYSLKTDDWECEVTINGAERTTLLSAFSEDRAKSSEIIYLNLNIKLLTASNGMMVSSMDVWNNIRISDESGEEVKPFEYALPGDETSVIMLEEGENLSCTIPYEVEKGTRYVEAEMYQNTEYSNKIKVNID